MNNDWNALISELKSGSIRALSRLVTRVENREPGWMEAMKEIFPETGKARLIGITGAPGSGKSTLTNRIARTLVEKGFDIGIIAVDPSSPFSGGALLGDRLRMRDVSNVEGVYVRSMATRGALGGLNQSARDVVKIMEAFGKDFIIIETVGVGQDEIDVIKIADMVMVVLVPGQGDAIQAIKAGIMEIADVFVVNKADREGADQVVIDIEAMLNLDIDSDAPKPPVLRTIALDGEGVPELVEKILAPPNPTHRQEDFMKERVKEELIGLVEKEIVGLIKDRWNENNGLERAVRDVLSHERDPYSIAQEIIAPLVPLLKKN
ncbi:MAG: methylmalonyl Co-A mutase-associated GTPase MeaB [Desulfatiglans sp.]|nr:methylmalonyl Co-A mutase-associated GTPase MeaB [Thermodesulfobacteriota bacterium]MEE4354686.1 methylmalonyl Co-A mutase-associated GTPase MeaB [Desulfatiglans sp.]